MHRIRLRRPWMRTAVGQAEAAKVEVPDGDPPPARTLDYERSFNCPTGLEQGDRVWLTISRLTAVRIAIMLNDQTLVDTPADKVSFPLLTEITPQLRPSNRVLIRLQAAAESTAVIDGEVALEIQSRSD